MERQSLVKQWSSGDRGGERKVCETFDSLDNGEDERVEEIIKSVRGARHWENGFLYETYKKGA